MNPALYRTHVRLQRTPDPMPRWMRATAMWMAIALGIIVLSRGVTVATMDDAGPPPSILAQAG